MSIELSVRGQLIKKGQIQKDIVLAHTSVAVTTKSNLGTGGVYLAYTFRTQSIIKGSQIKTSKKNLKTKLLRGARW